MSLDHRVFDQLFPWQVIQVPSDASQCQALSLIGASVECVLTRLETEDVLPDMNGILAQYFIILRQSLTSAGV